LVCRIEFCLARSDPTSVLDTDTDDEFESTGRNTRSESITSILSARVVDRLPNGNLIIQAVREILVSGERQVMVVSGIIRPVDIDDTNSIASTKIADLQIQYGGTGNVSDTMRRGWFTKALSYIWPL
jgi:flagellar L-ring protein precursor FlgH